jgi:ATP phosphoribosyltransferase regulatory subunit
MMLPDDRWLLPDGIEEVLPAEASRLEILRRQVLDLFESWGYAQVMTPMIEYIESLLVGTGRDLDLRTFKLVDQATGRLMGLRADITPQVARIDARNGQADTPARFCYLGTVLHTQSDHLEKTRSPLQVGAELYGHKGCASDLEVIRLMLDMLAVAGLALDNVHLDLGHVGIFRELAAQAGLNPAQEAGLFDILQRKAAPDLRDFFAANPVAPESARMLAALVELHGDAEVIREAGRQLAGAGEGVARALAELETIASALARRFPRLPVHFDLAELRGYHYHRGVVFAALQEGYGRELARGGRYDGIGQAFGRARPATGFSADLKVLARLARAQGGAGLEERTVFAPDEDDEALDAKVDALRAGGWRVVRELAGQAGGAAAMGCQYELRRQGGGWECVPAAGRHPEQPKTV